MMGKIRVFQFPIRNSNGGITHYAVNNWRYIDKNKFECDFGTVSKKIDFEDEIFNLDAGLKYISCYAEENEQQFVDDVRNIFRRGNYDVVHLHTSFWKSFLVEQIAIDCKIPKIIVHSHSTRIDIEDDVQRIEAEKIHNIRKSEFNTSLATDFCACSKVAADWLFGEQIPKDRIKIMNNAIDVDKFIYNKDIRSKYRTGLGLDDCFVIGHVGRMAYQKNHEFLLNVFAEVANKISNARLLLIGDGPLKNDIELQAERLKINDKIIFAGQRNDVNNLMQAMDLFCLPSRFEGLPIVLIEAQTAGLKCIAADTITDEICISNNICLLPNKVNKWSEMIFNFAKGYNRDNMYNVITDAGYNLKYQIKEIEFLYNL